MAWTLPGVDRAAKGHWEEPTGLWLPPTVMPHHLEFSLPLHGRLLLHCLLMFV